MPFSSTSGPMPTPLLGERTLRLESEIAFIFRSSSVRRANLKRPRGFRHAIYEWVARFQVPPPLVVQSADNDAVGRPAGDPWLNVTPNASTPIGSAPGAQRASRSGRVHVACAAGWPRLGVCSSTRTSRTSMRTVERSGRGRAAGVINPSAVNAISRCGRKAGWLRGAHRVCGFIAG